MYTNVIKMYRGTTGYGSDDIIKTRPNNSWTLTRELISIDNMMINNGWSRIPVPSDSAAVVQSYNRIHRCLSRQHQG